MIAITGNTYPVRNELTLREQAVRNMRNALFEVAHEGADAAGQEIIVAASLHADALDYDECGAGSYGTVRES